MRDGDIVGRPSATEAAPLTPEATLHAIFTQAFSGEPIHLPQGATLATLRNAVYLDPGVSRRIFQDARLGAAPRPAPMPMPMPKARALPAGGSEHKPRRRPVALRAAGWLCLGAAAAGAGYYVFMQPPPTIWSRVATPAVYAAATNDPTALQTLEARADANDTAAQFDLATLLDSNLLTHETSTAKNDEQATWWYQEAALAGYAPAENNLGYAYQTSHGVAQNDALAAKWYQLAAAQGLANAQNSLGFLYQNGLGVAPDETRALQCYSRAAAQGLAVAQNNLAAAFEAGRGTPQDYTAAAHWFARAAAQGEPNAQNSLGYLYYRGLGVARDAAQSRKFFALAAAQGMAAAQLNLGLIYARGAGVPRDNVTAAKWFLLARRQGDGEAGQALAALTPKLTEAQYAAAAAAAKTWRAGP